MSEVVFQFQKEAKHQQSSSTTHLRPSLPSSSATALLTLSPATQFQCLLFHIGKRQDHYPRFSSKDYQSPYQKRKSRLKNTHKPHRFKTGLESQGQQAGAKTLIQISLSPRWVICTEETPCKSWREVQERFTSAAGEQEARHGLPEAGTTLLRFQARAQVGIKVRELPQASAAIPSHGTQGVQRGTRTNAKVIQARTSKYFLKSPVPPKGSPNTLPNPAQPAAQLFPWPTALSLFSCTKGHTGLLLCWLAGLQVCLSMTSSTAKWVLSKATGSVSKAQDGWQAVRCLHSGAEWINEWTS